MNHIEEFEDSRKESETRTSHDDTMAMMKGSIKWKEDVPD